MSGEPLRAGSAPTAGSLLRAVSWMGAGHAASQAVWYGSLLVLAALLPPSAFGTVAVGMVIVQVSWLLIDSGLTGSLVVAPDLTASQLRGAVRFNLAFGVGLAALAAAFATPVTETFAAGGDADVLRGLAIGIVVYSLAVVPLALLQKRLDFRRYAFVMVASASVGSGAGIAVALAGGGVWSLVVRQVLYQALIAALAWTLARRLLPPRDIDGSVARWYRPPSAASFAVLTFMNFLAFNLDYLIVGQIADAYTVGLYALAFTIAFAPLTQVAAQIGRVVRSATAATADPAVVASRTLAGMRAVAVMLVPLAPPSIALAPHVVPAVFGDEWKPMVAPFQILVVAGVGHAVLEIMATALAGAGAMAWRAKVSVPWMTATAVALVVLVRADGIRGAAIAHLVLFVPLAAAYVFWGSKRVGLDARGLANGLKAVAGIAAAQTALTAFVVWAAPPGLAGGLVGSAAGLALATAFLWRSREVGRIRAAL